jgi:uncharacterized phiE125 gp8 family phage protein
MLDLELVTPPTDALLSAEEMRAQCDLDTEEYDALLAAYLATATAHLDGPGGILGRGIGTQTWRLYLDSFPRDMIRLPLPPLQAVTGITYVDPNGATQTLSTDVYTVLAGERTAVVRAYGQVWPSIRAQQRAVTVTFRCGWALTGAAWPAKVAPIRQAVRLMVRAMFDKVDTWTDVGLPLLRPLRIPRL